MYKMIMSVKMYVFFMTYIPSCFHAFIKQQFFAEHQFFFNYSS